MSQPVTTSCSINVRCDNIPTLELKACPSVSDTNVTTVTTCHSCDCTIARSYKTKICWKYLL